MKSRITNLVLVSLLAIGLCSAMASAAKTLVGSRLEMMDAAINSDAFPTMTTTTAGTCVVHRSGARLTNGIAAPGRCGVMKAADLERSWTMAATGIQTEEGWIRIRRLGTTSAGGNNYMIGARRTNEQSFQIGHHGNGEIIIDDAFIGRTNTGYILSTETWYYFVFTIQLTAGPTLTDVRLEIKPLGGNFTQVYNRTGLAIGFASPIFQIFNTSIGDTSRWVGHIAAFGQYALGAMADSQIMPANVIDPAASGVIWSAAATGVTNNDGGASSPFPLDVPTLNDEFLNGIGPGDFLTIDNSTGIWDMGANSMTMDLGGASNLSVQFLGPRANRKCHKDITAATWANVSGNIWSTTDGGAADLTRIVVFENGAAMTHPVGANFAAVTAALTAAPGFWTDGTTIYVHATGDGNPSSNGKTYLRSRNRVVNAAPGQPVLRMINAKNLRVYNFGTQYASLVDPANNDDMSNVFGTSLIDTGCSGFIECYDFDLDYTGKHFGSQVLMGGMTVRWIRPRIGHGYPYGTPGSATTFADQSSDETQTAKTEYIQPVSSTGCDAVLWICHRAGGITTGKVASATWDRPFVTGDISNQGGICTLVSLNMGTVGTLIGDAAATMNVGFTKVNGTATFTTAVTGAMWTPAVPSRLRMQ